MTDVLNPATAVDDETVPETSRADWASDQEVRWCPGCGDYSILTAMQLLMPELGVRREKTVFISGIGCAARFPYYMNTYGVHTIHGRAPAVATGLAMARPDLDVWVIGGDGDIRRLGHGTAAAIGYVLCHHGVRSFRCNYLLLCVWVVVVLLTTHTTVPCL